MPVAWLTWVLVAATGAVTRQGAQDAARQELAKRAYQQARPPWYLRPIRWILREIARLWSAGASHTGGSAGLTVLLAAVALVVGLVIWRVGPGAGSSRGRSAALNLGAGTTADDHRTAAERLAAQGSWAQAVRERLRAIARDLEARALVDQRPGRTASELATEGGRSLPSCSAMLREAADRFASIWYGSAVATAEDYRRLTEIDNAVQAARPVRTADPATVNS